MHCPHCLYQLSQGTSNSDVVFEFCPRCGTIFMDFRERPSLYQAVEAQVSRWERLAQVRHEKAV